MIVIDGSEGEGGGQMLRNALALSIVTGQPFRIDNIRGKRPKPGLMRQHVTAVEAACTVCGGDADGLAVGSTTIVFRPGRPKAGDYQFAVGTAGSTGLILQTILMPLVLADGPSRLVIEGGTHNLQAPPFDFIARTFLPLVCRMGPQVTARLVKYGFYPAGGGKIEVDIVPARLKPVALIDRGELREVGAKAIVAQLSYEIAKREIASARAVLPWPEEVCVIEQLTDQPGPGNVLLLEARVDQVKAVITQVPGTLVSKVTNDL